jgi:hypothetical protein
VEGDEIRIRGVADRHIHFSPYFVELGHTMPSAFPTEVIGEVLRVFRSGVRALGIRLGAAKGDMKYCPSRGGAVVGEIAARLSGGYMSGWTYPYASGIDVTREALRLCVGLHLDIEKNEAACGSARATATDRGWVSAERAFISVPGKVASIEGCLEAESMPYIKQVFLRAAPGDRVVFPANNVEKCGNVISQAPTRKDAVLAAESAARAMLIRLAPGDPETEAFLARGASDDSAAGGWPPFAFCMDGAATQELSAMPEYLDGSDRGGGSIAPFALAESVGGLDWSGRGYAESAILALDLANGRRGAESNSPRVLAGRFWRALARGGLQAAVYVLDTEALSTAGAGKWGSRR